MEVSALFNDNIGLKVLFLALFNYLFDEKVDLKLSTIDTAETRMINWNKINAIICFNFMQQKFILIASTMQALAQGKKNAALKIITCLLECTTGMHFELHLDDHCLKDIADILKWQDYTPESSETE